MNRRDRRKAGMRGPQANAPLQVHMANKGEQVIIEFSSTLKWIGLTVTDAEEFIAKLQSHVDKLKMAELNAERSH